MIKGFSKLSSLFCWFLLSLKQQFQNSVIVVVVDLIISDCKTA